MREGEESKQWDRDPTTIAHWTKSGDRRANSVEAVGIRAPRAANSAGVGIGDRSRPANMSSKEPDQLVVDQPVRSQNLRGCRADTRRRQSP